MGNDSVLHLESSLVRRGFRRLLREQSLGPKLIKIMKGVDEFTSLDCIDRKITNLKAIERLNKKINTESMERT